MVKIYIYKVGVGKRGILYDVEFDGEVICQSSLTPLLDACRVLLSRGLTGNVEMWDYVRPYPRMRSTIEGAAQLTVTDRGAGPVFVKWRPKSGAEAAGGETEDVG